MPEGHRTKRSFRILKKSSFKKPLALLKRAIRNFLKLKELKKRIKIISKNKNKALITNHREKRGAIMEGISAGLLISAGLFFAYLAIFSFLATFTPINIFAFATGMFFSMLTWFCIQAAIPLLEGSDNDYFDSNIASYSREESYYERSDSQGGYHKEHNIREYTRAVTK
ncbi:hypothetical protein ACQ4LE_010525 [Meloidogyne hapla]|uniref:Transmembrane protein n=1 Tax=Meloidogyne hapla TaxID=6305 RepID=A0A1I8BPF1_MELHA